jgi:hypothetical protein
MNIFLRVFLVWSLFAPAAMSSLALLSQSNRVLQAIYREPQDQTKGRKKAKNTLPAGVIETVERDGLRLTLMLEKSVYRPNEPIQITAKLHNLSSTPVECVVGAAPDSPVGILVSSFWGYQLLPHSRYSQGERADFVTLAAGQEIISLITWDQIIHARLNEPMQAPSGSYQISAVAMIRQSSGSLEVEASLFLEGGVVVIPGEAALMKAIHQTEVINWLESQGGEFLYHGDGNQVGYRLVNGKLQMGITRYQPLRGKGDHGSVAHCSMHFESGPTWKVRFSGLKKDDQPSSEMVVIIDAANGKVVKVESK